MSGPHAEDEAYPRWIDTVTPAELERLLGGEPEELAPPRRGFHHDPPTTMPPLDDEEDVGAEDGE